MINDHKAHKKLRVYLGNEVIDYETQYGAWKIQLTMQVSFISSKYFKETRTMYIKSDNIEIMMGIETDDIISGFIDCLLQNYQKKLEEPMRGSEFIPDIVDLLYYQLQKTNLKRGRSYIMSPK